ncbi:hypothetical protein CPB86DRAFT_802693 [Serendipita vermifera]|nr:hypothetical protein CPB86DRAFT_802693 [Serendipita vermifera]
MTFNLAPLWKMTLADRVNSLQSLPLSEITRPVNTEVGICNESTHEEDALPSQHKLLDLVEVPTRTNYAPPLPFSTFNYPREPQSCSTNYHYKSDQSTQRPCYGHSDHRLGTNNNVGNHEGIPSPCMPNPKPKTMVGRINAAKMEEEAVVVEVEDEVEGAVKDEAKPKPGFKVKGYSNSSDR